MDKLEKDKIRKRMSDLLDEYEEGKLDEDLETDWEMELYHALWTINQLWPEITKGE